MNRSQLDKYITDYYGVRAERLFEKNPGFQAYRHNDTKKWFAMIMDLPESRLGLDGQEIIDVINLKCDPILIGSLRLTVALDERVPDEQLRMLVDMSYELTRKKFRRKNK